MKMRIGKIRTNNKNKQTLYDFPQLFKATPHNSDGTISPPEISSDETKFLCVVGPAQRNFVNMTEFMEAGVPSRQKP